MTSLVLPDGATPTALQLPQGLSYDEWTRVGHMLGRMGKAIQWWIGDFLIYGENHYGELYAQAASETGYSEESLKNYQWVSSRIPPEVRRLTLSWTHHQIVAASDNPKFWLDAAEDEGWSVRQLREAVKGPPKPKAICGHPDCPMKEVA